MPATRNPFNLTLGGCLIKYYKIKYSNYTVGETGKTHRKFTNSRGQCVIVSALNISKVQEVSINNNWPKSLTTGIRARKKNHMNISNVQKNCVTKYNTYSC